MTNQAIISALLALAAYAAQKGAVTEKAVKPARAKDPAKR